MPVFERITLYELAGAETDIRFSPHCWKTRFALAHKGIEADRIPWHFSEKDAIAFSGQDLVPVLTWGPTAVSDSWRIASYPEERFPDQPALFGSGEAAPLARFANEWADAILLPALARIILLDVFECLDERDRAYFRQSRETRFGMSLERLVADPEKSIDEFRKSLEPLRRVVASHDFVSGKAPAYADYCIFGMFMWAYCTSSVELIERGDAVWSWRERLFDLFGGMARYTPRARRRAT